GRVLFQHLRCSNAACRYSRLARLCPVGMRAARAAAHADGLRPNATGLAGIVPGTVRLSIPSLRLEFSEKHRPRIVNAIERFGGHLGIARLRSDRDAHEFLAMLGRG